MLPFCSTISRLDGGCMDMLVFVHYVSAALQSPRLPAPLCLVWMFGVVDLAVLCVFMRLPPAPVSMFLTVGVGLHCRA